MKRDYSAVARILSVVLILTLALAVLAACSIKKEKEEATVAPASFNIGALKGPTSMGLAKMIHDAEASQSGDESATASLSNDYTFTLAGSPDELTPAFIKGELDMICVPANLAAVLYQKTGGDVRALAVNTLGVLYIVDNDDSVHAVSDLKGKEIVASGKGSTPEYALNYILTENGLDPDKDVTIDWKSEHAECVAALASGKAAVAMLPQPFVTVAQNKVDNLKIGLDLTKEWDKLDIKSSLITGVIIARAGNIEGKTAQVDSFLKDYAASVEFVNGNIDEASEIIGDLGIVDSNIAKKAIPYCNIVCITGEEMNNMLAGYLEVLCRANPASLGGALPGENFYFKK